LRFYGEVLGVEGDVRETDDGFVVTTPSRVHFTLLRGEPPASMGDFHFGVSLADADVSVKVLDPDGYVVEVSWDAP